MRDLVIGWEHLLGIRAVDSWPTIEIEWRLGSRLVHPAPESQAHPWIAAVEVCEQFAVDVELALETAIAHIPGRVVGGWHDAPEIAWEPVAQLPGTPRNGAGAFRSAATPEHPVATGNGATNESLWTWLTIPRANRPNVGPHREYVLTGRHLYIQRHDDKCWRIPTETLRARIGEQDGHAVYVFGKRTFVLLPDRRNCSVAIALDRRLGF
jgi:hypothetical protein